jgi:hypothetical protein
MKQRNVIPDCSFADVTRFEVASCGDGDSVSILLVIVMALWTPN